MFRFILSLRAALVGLGLVLASLSAHAQLAAAERAALVNLHTATTGSGWTDQTNWLSGDPCGPDAWFGVVCSGDGTHVTELHLSNNNLAGTLPDLSALSSLERLNLSDNRSLTGPLTTIGTLTALIGFWGNGSAFTGYLPDLPSMTALEYFYAMDNQLIGPIPDISGLSSLKDFRVSTNRLTGTPPAAPGGLNAGGSSLCPNYLHSGSSTDPAWSTATGETDWSQWCTPGYLVTVNAGAGGSASPSPGAAVLPDETVTVTFAPDAGHTLGAITSTCGVTSSTDTSYTTAAINADCAVTVSFNAVAAPAATPVPTLGQWALALLGLLAAGLGMRRLRR